MGYCIEGHISSRQKIELGTLGQPVIKPVSSAYSSTCKEHVGTKLSFGRKLGEIWAFLTFAISVDKPVAFIFLIMCFSQNTQMYDISTLSNFQVINPTRSCVFLLQRFLEGTCEIMSRVPHQTKIQ